MLKYIGAVFPVQIHSEENVGTVRMSPTLKYIRKLKVAKECCYYF